MEPPCMWGVGPQWSGTLIWAMWLNQHWMRLQVSHWGISQVKPNAHYITKAFIYKSFGFQSQTRSFNFIILPDCSLFSHRLTHESRFSTCHQTTWREVFHCFEMWAAVWCFWCCTLAAIDTHCFGGYILRLLSTTLYIKGSLCLVVCVWLMADVCFYSACSLTPSKSIITVYFLSWQCQNSSIYPSTAVPSPFPWPLTLYSPPFLPHFPPPSLHLQRVFLRLFHCDATTRFTPHRCHFFSLRGHILDLDSFHIDKNTRGHCLSFVTAFA